VGSCLGGFDGAILFEPVEEVSDQMARFVEVLVVAARGHTAPALGPGARQTAPPADGAYFAAMGGRVGKSRCCSLEVSDTTELPFG
jgi:hypothetical protein